MFILTAYRVMMVKRELRNITQRSNSDNQTYIFFLRLVIIMGISWSFEIIFYLVQFTEFWSDFFLMADYLNWSQGINLFVLFILKPSTFKLIRNQMTLNQARSVISINTNAVRITASGSTSSDKNSTSV
ncbi:probable G-protein coupled receptor Mth-like 3 [Drosophila takahashii]|uniref:probable G-protein coupled receptor Mth-like 3 n=1 Tax=Drosophila takahashii TaxID=29030 RepID=UPI00389920CB